MDRIARKVTRVPETPESGTILVASQPLSELKGRAKAGRRRRRRAGTELSLDIVSESAWAFNIRADLFLEHIFDSLLVHHQANIKAGQKADGSGAQPPLSRKTLFSNQAESADDRSKGRVRAGQRTRKSMHRGFKTGFFADTIRRTRITGSTRTANVKMLAHPHRNAFVATEASGTTEGRDTPVQYFYIEGDAEKVISEAVAQVFALSLEGQIKVKPDRGEKTPRGV